MAELHSCLCAGCCKGTLIMSYGLSVVNDAGTIIIDNTYKILVFSERGSFRITSQYTDKPGYGGINFSKPITTVEPPQIFIRRESGVTSTLTVYCRLRGSSGNWTGFTLISGAGGSALQNHLVEYVACKFSDTVSTDNYGLNMWDESGDPIFSSSDKIVKYGKFTKSWGLDRSRNPYSYTSGLTIDEDDFICISSIDRGVNWMIDQHAFVSLTIISGNARVLKMTGQLSAFGVKDWYWQGTRGTKFTIPVCKFPITRYYNT